MRPGDLAERDGQAGGGAAVAHGAEEAEEEAFEGGVAEAVRTIRADQAAARARAAVWRDGDACAEEARGEGGAAAAAAAGAREARWSEPLRPFSAIEAIHARRGRGFLQGRGILGRIFSPRARV